MGLSGWARYPVARLRARRPAPERPWIVPAAIGHLRRRIRPSWSILELGSGRSTSWYARRAGSVLSFEDIEFWAHQTEGRLAELGIENAELRRQPVEGLPERIAALPDAAFDLVVIDFLEAPGVSRVDCVGPARGKLRPGGLLLLDDSDRPGYARAYELLEGWRERRFTGVKDEWPQVCETAIFRKPAASVGAHPIERAPLPGPFP
ncbi:MAG: class I SAM-dependent methyltransferase [Solirubrobacterales bacterium]|nr:class I SAM-dependent methyltransferase [Solirubrobacterales bacterium]